MTYRRADGELIGGEFTTVGDLEYFDDEADESWCLEVVEERWTLVSRRTLKLGRTDRWCASCDDDVTVDEPVDGPVYCPKCEPLPPAGSAGSHQPEPGSQP